MRLLKGVIAGYLWCVITGFVIAKTSIQISNDIQFLSAAIVVAGALASGDN